MKVLMIDPSGFTRPYNYCLCNALAGKDCSVKLITSKSVHPFKLENRRYQEKEFFYKHSNLLIDRYGAGSVLRILKGVEHLADMYHFTRYTKDEKADIIHAQWFALPEIDWLFFNALKLQVNKLVYTVHNVFPHQRKASDKLIFSKIYGLFDGLITHTQYSKNLLIRNFGIASSRIQVIPHGNFNYLLSLDGARHNSLSIGNEVSQKRNILFFGRIHPYKGLDVLIRAFAKVSDQIKDANLLIVGKPSVNASSYRRLINQCSLSDKVTMVLEYVPDEDIRAYFSISDLVVLPYRQIDQSGVALLACTMGKPIVATNVGGLDEVVCDGKNGRLVTPGDADALAEAVIEMLLDKEKLREYGDFSRKLAETKFNWDCIATKTIELYKELKTQ